jgi:tetratricopeptide (TPR) repeat protein
MAGNQQLFEQAMNDGHNAAWDQDWQRAANYYRLALEQFPENHTALTNLGLALFELRDYTGALKVYQRAALTDPGDPVPVEKIAHLLEKLKRPNEAARASAQAAEMYLKARDPEKSLENWMRVIQLQPENLTAHARLALIYERMGHKAEAVNYYLTIAALLQKAGDVNKATQSVMYALKIMPGSAEATQALQDLKSNQPLALPDLADQKLPAPRKEDVRPIEPPADERLIPSLDPITETAQRALVQLAEILFEEPEGEGEDTVGRKGIDSVIRGTGGLPISDEDQQRIKVLIGQAIEWQTQGEEGLAASELDKAMEIGISHPALHYDLGWLLAGKDPEKAAAVLEKAARHPDYAMAAYLLLGRLFYEQRNFTQAGVYFMKALRLADAAVVPEYQAEEILQSYGPVIESLGKQSDEKILKGFCETILSQLVREDWRDMLIKARQQLPIQEEGASLMPVAEMMIESHGGQAIEAMAMIKDLARRGKVRSALEEAFRALDHSPTYLPLHVQIGELLMQEGLAAEATQKFMLVAQLYRMRGQLIPAVKLLKRLVQNAPMDLQARNQLIELLTAQGKMEEVMQQHLELAEIYYHLGELNNARQGYLTALRLLQQTQRNRQMIYEILSHLADIDMQRLEWRQALRTYEQMRLLKPDDRSVRQRIVDIHFRLGNDQAAYAELDNYLKLLEKKNRGPDAVSFIYALIADQPEKPELRGRLAEFHLREGKVGMAISELDQLAIYYEDNGDIPNAVRTVEQILELEPLNREEYETALLRLRSLM